MDYLFSLRSRLLLLILIAVVPALGLILWNGLAWERSMVSDAHAEAQRLASLAVHENEHQVQVAQLFATMLADAVKQPDMDPKMCGSFLASLGPLSQTYRRITVLDPAGRVLCQRGLTGDSPDPRVRVAVQEAVDSKMRVIGDYEAGSETDNVILPIAQPILDSGGRVQQVVFLSADLSWLEEIVGQVRLPAGSVLSVVSRGNVVARFPTGGGNLDVRQPFPTSAKLSGDEGMFQEQAATGDEWLHAYARLKDAPSPTFIDVAIPARVAFADADAQFRLTLVLLGASTVTALAVAWGFGDIFILRRISPILETTRRITAGDLRARTGVRHKFGELSQLASEVDKMAAELEHREGEIRNLNTELEERVRARTAELEAANCELDAFAYSVSHDLRTPLSGIDGFVRLLRQEHASQLDVEGQRYLQLVQGNVEAMTSLVNALLDLSRSSRRPLEKREVAPAEIAREALARLTPLSEGRQLDVTIGDLPACRADPVLLKQVYVNLLSNAIKFTRTRPVARIRVKGERLPETGELAYSVSDNGVGFDMNQADKLFGTFQRLHGEDDYPGNGVGLSIVQRIVHRHGGRVWAEGQVDQGATFFFTLSS